MNAEAEKPILARTRMRWPYLYDIVALLVYTAMVHAWSVTLYPLGRDYAMLESRGAGLPMGAAQLVRWEIETFGASVAGYHVVNVALMYACMLCLYFLVIRMLKSPPWIGALAAVLFMANPVHTESTFSLCGAADLVPCLAALIALLAYATYADVRGALAWIVALTALTLAGMAYRENAFLFAVPALMELFGERGRRLLYRMTPILLSGGAAVWRHGGSYAMSLSEFQDAWLSLFLIVYPIGLLPETVQRYHEWPWLFAGVCALFLACLWLLCRALGHKAIVVGAAGMIAVFMGAGVGGIDLVQMGGAGKLLLATALCALAFAGVVSRLMQCNAKWRSTFVYLTTLLCVIFFIMKIAETPNWRAAGNLVQSVQRAADIGSSSAGEAFAIIPDYQYYRGAPMRLSESIRHETPFSAARSVALAAPLQYEKPDMMRVALERVDARTCRLRVEGRTALYALPGPYSLVSYQEGVTFGNARVTLVENRPDGFSLIVEAVRGEIPSRILPVLSE